MSSTHDAAGADRVTQALSRLIVESAVDGVICADRDGFIRVWNPGAERLLGYLAEEAIGQTLDLVLPDQPCRARHWAACGRWMDSGEDPIEEPFGVIPLVHKSGDTIELESTFVRVRDDEGHPVAAGAIVRPAGMSSVR